MKFMVGIALMQLAVNFATAYLCDKFSSPCPADVGKPLHNANGQTIVKLDAGGFFYFSFSLASSSTYDLALSTYFGSVEIYAAKNREPKPNDYDISNVVSGEQDFLRLVRLYVFFFAILSNFTTFLVADQC